MYLNVIYVLYECNKFINNELNLLEFNYIKLKKFG